MLHHCLVAIKKPFLKLLPIPEPVCWKGNGRVADIGKVLGQFTVQRPLVVTDPILVKLGLLDRMLEALTKQGIEYAVFDGVAPDPSFAEVRRGVACYQQGQCDGVIAFGGGSPMDCAKAIAASVTTGRDISALIGLLKVRRRLPPVIAIPTTAGTGSEATVAAVISDTDNKQKAVVTDPVLVPRLAILDPTVSTGLPPKVTAEAGVDALTHAIESYLSSYADQYTRRHSIEAIQLIFSHLPRVYKNGNNLKGREAMAVASYKAGLAFTRTYVGYVHAFSHQLGGFYHVPHGRLNAILLPKVLEFSFEKAKAGLAELARAALSYHEPDDHVAARHFVDQVKSLLTSLDFPEHLVELQAEDIPELARRARAEAFGVYPVPRAMSTDECEQLLNSLCSPAPTKLLAKAV